MMTKKMPADIPFKIPDLFVKMESPAPAASSSASAAAKDSRLQAAPLEQPQKEKLYQQGKQDRAGSDKSRIFTDPGAAITPDTEILYRKMFPQVAAEADQETSKPNILAGREDLVRGIIWAEVLRKPRALRSWEEDEY